MHHHFQCFQSIRIDPKELDLDFSCQSKGDRMSGNIEISIREIIESRIVIYSKELNLHRHHLQCFKLKRGTKISSHYSGVFILKASVSFSLSLFANGEREREKKKVLVFLFFSISLYLSLTLSLDCLHFFSHLAPPELVFFFVFVQKSFRNIDDVEASTSVSNIVVEHTDDDYDNNNNCNNNNNTYNNDRSFRFDRNTSERNIAKKKWCPSIRINKVSRMLKLRKKIKDQNQEEKNRNIKILLSLSLSPLSLIFIFFFYEYLKHIEVRCTIKSSYKHYSESRIVFFIF